MSLMKLLKAPIKLFKKEVITFVIIRRYDLGILDEKLKYVAVKPTTSISMLRHKIWCLLDLPDYCEEVIILKSAGDVELPLTQLRNGNDPQHPYVLEVWSPGTRNPLPSTAHNLLTIGNGEVGTISNTATDIAFEGSPDKRGFSVSSLSTFSNETMALNKHRVAGKSTTSNCMYSDFKKSDISCRISSTSLFRLNGRKSRDNFINVLMKMQSDLSTLSNKLSTLETRFSAD